MEANSKEDAQRLFQRERQKLQETLQRQKEQMIEDKKWLAKEERLLVGRRAPLTTDNPLCVSVCPPASKVSIGATLSRVSFSQPAGRSPSHALLKLNAPPITVPKRGSVSVFYKVNFPVLLQDPMGSEEMVSPVVGVNTNTSTNWELVQEYMCQNTSTQ